MSLNEEFLRGHFSEIKMPCKLYHWKCDVCPSHNECRQMFKELEGLSLVVFEQRFSAFEEICFYVSWGERGLCCNGKCKNCTAKSRCKQLDAYCDSVVKVLQKFSKTLDKP